MTATPTPLLELIAKWRATGDGTTFTSIAVRECADELEAALPARDEAGCGACGDGCKSRQCRHAEESPTLLYEHPDDGVKVYGYATPPADPVGELIEAVSAERLTRRSGTGAEHSSATARVTAALLAVAAPTPPATAGEEGS